MSRQFPPIETRVSNFFSVCQLKLFRLLDEDYVALFGEPAMAEDNWIINLPAAYFFQGSYKSLPFETLLNSRWAQTQSTIQKPLADYTLASPSASTWQDKRISLQLPSYERADLFRDVATILINADQPILALHFIRLAHNLRPEGPIINQMLNALEPRK